MNKKSATPWIIAGILAVALLILVALFLFSHQQSKVNQIPPHSVTTPQNKEGIPPASSQGSSSSPSTTDQIPKSSSMSMAIDSVVEQNGSVTYSGTVGNPVAGGKCSAIFTSKIDKPVTDTPVFKNNTCGPSSVPSTEFTSLGTWTLTLRYFTNSTQVSASKDIEIR